MTLPMQTSRLLAVADPMLSSIFEHAGVGLCLVGADDRILRVNPEWLRSTGFTSQDALGAHVLDLFSEATQLIEVNYARARTGETVKLPRHSLHLGGEVTWWDVTVSPVPLAEGIGVLITSREVSEEVLAEKREEYLSQQKYSFEAMVENSTDMVYRVSRDMRLLYINAAGRRMSGLTLDELVGRSGLELGLARELIDAAEAATRLAFETGHEQTFEFEVKAGGEERYFESRQMPEMHADGSVVSVLGVARDITEHKRAEEALRESEGRQGELVKSLEVERGRLAAVLESLPVGVWIADADGRLIGKNEEADRIWQGDAPLAGTIDEYRQYTAWYADSGRTVLPEEYPVARALLAGEPVGPVELRIRRFDGTDGAVLVSAAPIKGVDGRLAGAVGINVDITERTRAEEALRESEERLRLIATNSPDNVFIQDLELHYRWIGNSIPPFSLDHVLGKTDFDLASREEAKRLTEVKQKVIETGVGTRYEAALVLGGEERSFEAIYEPYRDEEGRIAGLFGYVRDITERKRSEAERERLLEELQSERARLEAIVENAPEGIVFTDDQARVLFANPAAERLYVRPVPYGESYDRHAELQLCHPDGTAYDPRDLPLTRAAMDGETSGNVGMAILWPDGQRGDLLVNCAPVRNEQGQVTGAVGVFQDVSRIKESERERERLLEEMKQVNRELTAISLENRRLAERANQRAAQMEEFISILSHDLKTPITVIQGQAQMVGRAAEKPEFVRKSAEAIFTSAKRMTAMITDLAEMGRLETGQLKLNRIPIDVPFFLDDLRGRLSGALSSARIELAVSEKLPAVPADPSALERILTNLLSNALKYSEGPVHVVAKMGADGVEIAVADRGPGISTDVLPRLFDRFYRGAGAEGKEGLGLGLYIARMLVEAHGGSIRVESRLGSGTKFTVSLPCVSG